MTYPKNGPEVTAVMPTCGEGVRRQFARTSLRSFRLQTYENRRMLILNHGKVPLLHPDVAQNSNVREVMVQWPETLGGLRNIAFKLVDTPYIINWDDDDWHGATRIAQQMYAIQRRKVRASSLVRYVTYDLDTNESLVRSCLRFRCKCCGGTIMHKVGDERYEALSKGEDTAFARLFGAVGQLVQVHNDPLLYLRTCHGSNVSGRSHVLRSFDALPIPDLMAAEAKRIVAAEFSWYGKTKPS